MRSELKEGAGVGAFIVPIVLVMFGLGALGTLLHLGMLPWVTKQETRVFRESLPYTDSKITALASMAEQVSALDVRIAESDGTLVDALRGQRRAIIGQMRQQAALLDAADVPATAATIIAGAR